MFWLELGYCIKNYKAWLIFRNLNLKLLSNTLNLFSDYFSIALTFDRRYWLFCCSVYKCPLRHYKWWLSDMRVDHMVSPTDLILHFDNPTGKFWSTLFLHLRKAYFRVTRQFIKSSWDLFVLKIRKRGFYKTWKKINNR